MANRFWVGGTGSWSQTAHWSTTSGGAGGASVPGSADAAVFNGSSGTGTVTLDANNTILSMSFHMDNLGSGSPVIQTFAFGNFTLTVAGDALWGNASIITCGTGGLTMTAAGTFECVTSSAATFTNVIINAPGATVTIADGDQFGVSFQYLGQYNITTLTLTAGTLFFPDGQYGAILTIGTFNSSNTNTRTIDFQWATFGGGGSILPTITINTAWNCTTSTNLTISHGNVLPITLGAGCTFSGGAKTYLLANITLLGGAAFTQADTIPLLTLAAGVVTVTGNLTITTLAGAFGASMSFSAGSTIGTMNNIRGMQFKLAPSTTNTWAVGGANGKNYGNVSLISSTPGTPATLTISGAQVVSWWAVKDITISGGPLVVYRGTDQGNNTLVTFMRGVAKYYTVDVYGYLGDYRGQYTDLIDDPKFAQEVNNPGSQITLKRGVDPLNFGEGTLVDYNNKLVVKVFSEDAVNGQTYLQGFIADYTPVIEEKDQYLEIVMLGYGDELSQYYVIADPTLDVNIAFNYNGDFGPYDRVAQSWTVGAGITNLFSVAMSFSYTGSGYDLYIYKDNGSNTPDNTTALSHIAIDGTGVIGNDGMNTFYFSPTLALTAGSKYWCVVVARAGGNVYFPLANSSTYAGGSAFHYASGAWTDAAVDNTQFQTYSSTGNTTVTYSNVNLKTVLQDMLNNYAIQGGKIVYNPVFSIDDPGTTMTWTFVTNTMLEGIQQVCDLAPVGWYWYIDQATNTFHFHQIKTTPTHYFTFGQNVKSVKLQRTMETVINTVLITGGPTAGVNLFRLYSNSASRSRYGQRIQTYNDSQLVNTTMADQIASKIINSYKLPSLRAPLEVFSNPDTGYFTESIKPGDTFTVVGYPNFPVLQIVRMDQQGDFISLDTSVLMPVINSTIEDALFGLTQQQTLANPSSPTQVAV